MQDELRLRPILGRLSGAAAYAGAVGEWFEFELRRRRRHAGRISPEPRGSVARRQPRCESDVGRVQVLGTPVVTSMVRELGTHLEYRRVLSTNIGTGCVIMTCTRNVQWELCPVPFSGAHQTPPADAEGEFTGAMFTQTPKTNTAILSVFLPGHGSRNRDRDRGVARLPRRSTHCAHTCVQRRTRQTRCRRCCRCCSPRRAVATTPLFFCASTSRAVLSKAASAGCPAGHLSSAATRRHRHPP